MALQTYRDTIRRISPRWLRTGLAEKILYSIAVHLDLLGDAAIEAVRARFPAYDGNMSSLPLIGRDRRIRRGRNESAESYALRLGEWLDKHRTRGGPYAMLGQLRDFWAAQPMQIGLVYASGMSFVMSVAGEISRAIVAWNPPAGGWARWWLFFDWPNPITNDGTWSDPGVWGDGGVWGSDLSPTDVADLRLVPEEWNAGHANGRIVLLNGDIELWGYPPGTWGDPGVWGGSGTKAELDVA